MSTNSGRYIVIKTANGTANDIRILCEENWRVFDLKVHLSAQHPLHPPVRGQKLIHSGKLLSDEAIVDTILPGDQEVVLHLVISPAHLRSNSIPARTPSHVDQERPVVPPANATPTNSTTYNENQLPRPNQFPNNPWLHYRSQMMPGNPNEQHPRPFPTNWPYPYMMNFSPYYAAQMAQWNQAIYRGQLQGGVVNNNQNVNNGLPANNLEQDGGAGGPEEPELQDDLAMNGGGFALMADNRRPRDLVDYGYMLMMLLFLGMIGYLTGSLYQFIIFFAGVCLILMNQGGWFRVQRRVITDPPQQPVQREQDQVDNEHERDIPGDNNQPEEEIVGPPQEQGQPQRQGLLATIMVFVTSFFTSLFPQQIPELQAN